jgi:hypothetical protein
LLCTYAKQQPPLLSEALDTIRQLARRTAHGRSSSSSGVGGGSGTTLTSSPSALAAVKYLTFLAQGEALFEAALSIGDVEMTRTIARQSQMDPKMYVPLLEGFLEAAGGDLGTTSDAKDGTVAGAGAGAGADVDVDACASARVSVSGQLKERETEAPGRGLSARQCHARHLIHTYLKRPADAAEWALRALFLSSGDELGCDRDELLKTALADAQAANAYTSLLPLCRRIETHLRSQKTETPSGYSAVTSAVQRAYGLSCLKQNRPREALFALLSCRPPDIASATEAACLAGDWSLAVSLGGAAAAARAACSTTDTVAAEGWQVSEDDHCRYVQDGRRNVAQRLVDGFLGRVEQVCDK